MSAMKSFFSLKPLVIVSTAILVGLAGCVTTDTVQKHSYQTPSLDSVTVNVVRDQKFHIRDSVDDQNCPMQLSINNINVGRYVTNQQDNYYLSPDLYTFKATNCSGTTVFKVDLHRRQKLDLLLSIDGHGHPMIVDKQ